jgi:periplasmic divalent cation tolerance protein
MWSPQTIIAWNEKRSSRIQVDPVAVYEFLRVSTAVESRLDAEKLVRAVVERRLAAGAQIVGPVGSAFWHLGEFGIGEEWQILLTTHSSKYAELEAYLLEHHPWDNPEIMAVPVVGGSEACLEWVRKSVLPGSGSN